MAALVLVGPDFRRGRRKLERLAARLRPSAPVILLGPVYGRERFDVVAGADVFVNTSRWEGMPIAVLEAAAQFRSRPTSVPSPRAFAGGIAQAKRSSAGWGSARARS
ncbi:MAG: glycosyltransferase family 4 protein, partial [Burkholderiales bacterium]